MQADLTRNTFRPKRHYTRVLAQQGRVMIDADLNEQAESHIHYARTLARDVIGPFGGPTSNCGFKPQLSGGDMSINPGHYYVDGILCEVGLADPSAATKPHSLKNQPYARSIDLSAKGLYLVLLDVWERHTTPIQDPLLMREVALGGPWTTTRSEVVWQLCAVTWQAVVSTLNTFASNSVFNAALLQAGVDAGELASKIQTTILPNPPTALPSDFQTAGAGFALALSVAQTSKALLKAQAKVETASPDPCLATPDARYRGPENQLYRVEIHLGSQYSGGPTYKWSRDNGSVVFRIEATQGGMVTLADLGKDPRLGLQPGDWVEILDDQSGFQLQLPTTMPAAVPTDVGLCQVQTVDSATRAVTLDPLPTTIDPKLHPYMRRWDQRPPATSGGPDNSQGIPVPQQGEWKDLEDGVQIQFQPSLWYESGDYWLIPARTAIGDVVWPTETTQPDNSASPFQLPDGVTHHYAPIASINIDGGNVTTAPTDLCSKFVQLSNFP